MSSPHEQILLGQESIRASLRQLTEAALLQYDNERLPAMLRAIGSIAGASLELTALTVNGCQIEPAAAIDVPPVRSTLPLIPESQPDTAIVRPGDAVQLEPLPVPAEQVGARLAAAPSIFETLPTRYHGALRYMVEHQDQVLRPGDIANRIQSPTPAARKQGLLKMMALLRAENKDVIQGQTGERSTRRYCISIKAGSSLLAKEAVIEPELSTATSIIDAEPSEQELAAMDSEHKSAMAKETDYEVDRVAAHNDPIIPPIKPSPLVMPPHRFGPPPIPKAETTVEAERVVTLTNWGLEFAQNGHREIKLKGERLRMREVAADTLLELAQHEEGMAFHELLAALKARGKNIDPTFLQGVLEEVKHVLATHAESKWSDEIRHDDDGGSRYIQLIGSKPLEDYPDFLVQQSGKRL